jgi:starch synthase
LEKVLQHRAGDLVGILNGIDKKHWSPNTDSYLVAQYGAVNIKEGKRLNKQELQKSLGLPLIADLPVVGMVSRMTHQKGFDLLTQIADRLFQQPAQFVFLGAGDPYFEEQVSSWFQKHPEKVAGKIGYDERLAHLIEAGSDFFLMPSQFEPCGLNQMYSMNYGTIPIVHSVGGLADSVIGISPVTEQLQSATGLVFDYYDSNMLLETCQQAIELYSQPDRLQQIIANGMKRDFSWNSSATQYVKTYEQAQQKLY